MKLSNRILIGFFAIIFIYMTAAFSEIRFRGDLNKMDDSNSMVEKVDIQQMSYLVIMPNIDARITVLGADQPRIEVRSLKGDVLQKLKYTLKGDTLILQNFNFEEKQRVRISIYVPVNAFRAITADHADLIIENLALNFLAIHQTGGRVSIKEHNKFGKLHIEAIENANLIFSGSPLDTLSAQIDDSEIVILSPVHRIEGAMSNDAYIKLLKVNDIAFKKDESSQFRLF